MNEVWKQVTYRDIRNPDGSPKYEVSNLGNVRKSAYRGYKGRHYNAKIIKQNYVHGSYSVTLVDNGVRETIGVSTLVAHEFIESILGAHKVLYIDGDSRNTAAMNLRIVHSNPPVRRVRQYTKAHELLGEFVSVREAARVLYLERTSIAKCCRRKQKTSGGFVWRYSDDDEFYKE